MDLAPCRARLDQLWGSFGPDKVMFGSDWPNSDHIAGLRETVGLVQRFIVEKDIPSREKFFFSNSHHAYKWIPRQLDQVLSG
jgi:L-fuconolactonase